MFTQPFRITVLALGFLAAATISAHADCETDLGHLEKAMASPAIKPEQSKALQDAGKLAAAALRKDDDSTCNRIIMDAFKANGVIVEKVATAANSAPLGDLSSFRAIVDDTEKLVQKADATGAKARIKDLETAWDKAQPVLQPKNSVAWEALDKSIDASLKQLRADKPDAKGSSDALVALLALIDKTK